MQHLRGATKQSLFNVVIFWQMKQTKMQGTILVIIRRVIIILFMVPRKFMSSIKQQQGIFKSGWK